MDENQELNKLINELEWQKQANICWLKVKANAIHIRTKIPLGLSFHGASTYCIRAILYNYYDGIEIAFSNDNTISGGEIGDNNQQGGEVDFAAISLAYEEEKSDDKDDHDSHDSHDTCSDPDHHHDDHADDMIPANDDDENKKSFSSLKVSKTDDIIVSDYQGGMGGIYLMESDGNMITGVDMHDNRISAIFQDGGIDNVIQSNNPPLIQQNNPNLFSIQTL